MENSACQVITGGALKQDRQRCNYKFYGIATNIPWLAMLLCNAPEALPLKNEAPEAKPLKRSR